MTKKLIAIVAVFAVVCSFMAIPARAETSCYTFARNLKVGTFLTQNEATHIRDFLAKEGLWSSDVNVTSYTAKLSSAIAAFQEKYASDILIPNDLTSGNGYFGPSTRAKMNALYGCSTDMTTAKKSTSSSSSSSASTVYCPSGYVCVPKTVGTITRSTSATQSISKIYDATDSTSVFYTQSPTGVTTPASADVVSTGNTSTSDTGTSQTSTVYTDSSSVATSNSSTLALATDTSTEVSLNDTSTDSSVTNVATEEIVTAATTGTSETTSTVGVYSIPVDYSKTLTQAITSAGIDLKNVDNNVKMGIYPTPSQTGTKYVNVKFVSVKEIFPNATERSRQLYVKYSLSDLYSAMKSKGYRPISIYELVALRKSYPSLFSKSYSAYGSVVELGTSVELFKTMKKFLNFGLDPAPYLQSQGFAKYVMPIVSKSSVVMTKAADDSAMINGVYNLGATFVVVEDATSSVTTTIKKDKAPTTSASSGGYYTVLTGESYTVNVTYGTRPSSLGMSTRDTVSGDFTGTKSVKIEMVSIVGKDGMDFSAAKTLLDKMDGYRPATALELYALNQQNPSLHHIAALGSFNDQCSGYPTIIRKVFLENNRRVYKVMYTDLKLLDARGCGWPAAWVGDNKTHSITDLIKETNKTRTAAGLSACHNVNYAYLPEWKFAVVKK